MHRGCRALGVVALATAACGVQAGCYKHVVRTEGYGARAEEIYEPNVSDKPGPVDTLLWGDPPKDSKRRNR